jgi:hypothetical protein
MATVFVPIIDYLGFLGRSPDEEHVFMVSGDSGQGITNGLVTGTVIADLITIGSSAWEDIYSPARKIHKNLGEYVSENITPLKNFAKYLSADEIASVERLRPGEGRLVRSGLQKVAACRDQKGQLHLHSASCTHRLPYDAAQVTRQGGSGRGVTRTKTSRYANRPSNP